MGAKMMVFECNVLRARSKLLRSCHCDARLIVLVLAHECRGLDMNRENLVDFFKKSNQWNDVSERLGESNVLSLSSTERDLGLQTAYPEDWTICIHYYVAFEIGRYQHCRRRPETNHQQSQRRRNISDLWTCLAYR